MSEPKGLLVRPKRGNAKPFTLLVVAPKELTIVAFERRT